MNRLATVSAAFVAAVWLMALLVPAHAAQAPQINRAEAAKLKNPRPATKQSLESGEGVFRRFCTKCHGDEGKGDGRQAPEGAHPANLTDDHWDHGSTDGEIFATIHDGVGPKYDMDSYEGKITDAEIWDVVNFIRSIGPKTPAQPTGR